jgi:hypothetical protein
LPHCKIELKFNLNVRKFSLIQFRRILRIFLFTNSRNFFYSQKGSIFFMFLSSNRLQAFKILFFFFSFSFSVYFSSMSFLCVFVDFKTPLKVFKLSAHKNFTLHHKADVSCWLCWACKKSKWNFQMPLKCK